MTNNSNSGIFDYDNFVDRNEHLNSDIYKSDKNINNKLSKSNESQNSQNYEIIDNSIQQKILSINLNNSENRGGKYFNYLL